MDKKEKDAPHASVANLGRAKDMQHFRDQCIRFSKCGDVERFEVAFEALKRANPPIKCVYRWQIRLAVMKKDFPSAIKCLQEIWNHELPFKPEVADSRLTQYYRRLKDHEVIMDCVRHALLHIPSYMPPVYVLAHAIIEEIATNSQNKISISIYQDHRNFKILLHQIIKLLRGNDPKRMRCFIRENLDYLDAAYLSRLGAATIASSPAAHAKYNGATSFAASPGMEQTPGEKASLARLYVEQGKMENAHTLLTSIAASEMTEEGQFLLGLIDDMPVASLLTRPDLAENTTDSEIVIAETPNARGTVIVFTGLADRAFMSTKLLDRYFSALGLSAIYLRDEQRYLYLNGISELGQDLPETIKELKKILKRLKTKKTYTFGASAGGYGAICYGLMLKAESILCFSTVTHIHPREGRAKILQKRLLKIRTLEELNLFNMLQDPKYQKTPVFLYYGELMKEDRIQAEILKPLRNVTLYPITGYSDHQSLKHIVCEKRLLSLLTEHYQINKTTAC